MVERRLPRLGLRTAPFTYGVAILAPVVALLVRYPLQFWLGNKYPYLTFFLAVAAASAFGGLLPGLVSTVLGGVLGLSILVPSLRSWEAHNAGDLLGFFLFLIVGSFISFLAGRLLFWQTLFRQTLLSIGDAVIALDTQGSVWLMNAEAERLTGWSEAEADGQQVSEILQLVAADTGVAVQLQLETILKGGRRAPLPGVCELVRRDGTRVSIDDSGAPIRETGGRVVGAVLVFRDVSERRRIESDLQTAELRARRIHESISDAFLLVDHQWLVREVNSAAAELIGAEPAAIIGRPAWSLAPQIVGTPMEEQFRNALASGVPAHMEYHHEPTDRWFDITAYPSPEGLGVYYREITRRKQSEAALRHRNEDLLQFTFAATHDLREPLRMITSYAQLLQRRCGDGMAEEAGTYTNEIIGSAHRISRLLDGLLQFSLAGEGNALKPEPVQPNLALEEALEDLRLTITETEATVSAGDLPQVLCNHTHLRQLFQNLVGNGIKYRRSGIRPVIRIEGAEEGFTVVIHVIDNGIGIPHQNLAEVFLPFKRLHSSEIAGAGIGLATCKRIVERYGGKIWLESEEGQGSVFSFSLPASEPKV